MDGFMNTSTATEICSVSPGKHHPTAIRKGKAAEKVATAGNPVSACDGNLRQPSWIILK